MDELQILTGSEDERVALIDLIDHLLDQGVVLQGELTLGLSGIDLVEVRISALLAAADRIRREGRARKNGTDEKRGEEP